MRTPMQLQKQGKYAARSGASAARRVGEETFPTRLHTPMQLQKQGKYATISDASAARRVGEKSYLFDEYTLTGEVYSCILYINKINTMT